MESHDRVLAESPACRMKGPGYCPQPLEAANAFLSKKWTISIIVTIGNFGTLRFTELLGRIDGISAKTLAARLKELRGRRLITRKTYPEIPPRVDYALTSQGKRLTSALIPLIRWSFKK